MAKKRRSDNIFGLAFLDAMTCGLGAVVLLYMVINASFGLRSGSMSSDLRGEVNKIEEEVLEGHKNLVELRNSIRQTDKQVIIARGLAKRVIENLETLQVELATFDQTNLAKREHINKLKTDIKTLEEESRRLAASIPDDETPGDRVRAFVGDGDRQYLTGLKLGGQRVLILVDRSASMLGETVVNVVRRRNLPDDRKIRAEKWQRAVATVDWLTTQLPRDGRFQVYGFAEKAEPMVDGSRGQWLDAGDRRELERAVQGLRRSVPQGGTSLQNAFSAIAGLKPPPDNLILITDGLPTQGSKAPTRKTVSGKDRLRHFNRATRALPPGLPVNVILFPMEGDPMAASSFWELAIATRGSFLSPSKDWP